MKQSMSAGVYPADNAFAGFKVFYVILLQTPCDDGLAIRCGLAMQWVTQLWQFGQLVVDDLRLKPSHLLLGIFDRSAYGGESVPPYPFPKGQKLRENSALGARAWRTYPAFYPANGTARPRVYRRNPIRVACKITSGSFLGNFSPASALPGRV